MKKFISKIFLFLLLLFIIYSSLLYVFGGINNSRFKPNLIYKTSHNSIRLNEVKNKENLDILFLGSSHAYRGFDTRIF